MNNLKCATCTGQPADSVVKKFGHTKGAVHQRSTVYECDEGHYTTEGGMPVESSDVVMAES